MRQAFAMSASVDVPEKSQVFSDSLRSRVYSALLDKVAQAVAVLDVEGRFLEMNDAHMGLMAPLDAIDTNDTPARYMGQDAFEAMMRALSATGGFGRRVQWSRSDGDRHVLEYQAFLVRSQGQPLCVVTTATDVTHREDAAGLLMGFKDERLAVSLVHTPAPAQAIGVARDITSRKSTEEALRHSQELLRQALQASNTWLWDWSVETNEMTCSKEWQRQLGYDEGELPDTFEQWRTRLHPADHDAAVAFVRSYVATPQGDSRLEYRLRHKNGTYRWIAAHASLVTDCDGRGNRLVWMHTDITEQRRTEEALRASEERLLLAAEGSSDALWDGRRLPGRPWNDPETPIWWSSRTRDILGLSAGESIETFGAWLAHVHADDVGHVVSALSAHMVTRVPYDVVYRFRTSTGQYRWIRGRGQAMWDETGEPIRMSGSCQDVTEQKRAESELRDSEERLRAAFSNAAIGMVFGGDIQESGLEEDVNPAFCAMLGYTGEELRQLGTRGITHPDDLEKSSALVRQLQAREVKSGTIEMRYLRKDGGLLWALTSVSSIRNAEGQYRSSLALIQDITQRKHAEVALRTSEERYARATAIAKVGVWEVDYRSGFYNGDANLHAMFGYEPGEIGTNPQAWLRLVHEDDRGIALATHDAVYHGNLSVYECELCMLHKSGKHVWTMVRGSLQRDEVGRPIRLTGATVDITERRLAEQALRASEERFAKAFRASPHPITITELGSGKVVDANRAASEKFGYAPSDIVVQTTETLRVWVKPEQRAQFLEHVRRDGSVADFPALLRTKDGEVRNFLISSEKIELGGAQCLVTVGTDITERTRTEKALLQVAEGVSAVTGAAFFQSLVEHLSRVLDVDYVVVTVPVSPGAPRVRTVAMYGEGRPLDNLEYDLSGTPCERVLRGAAPCLISDGLPQAFPGFPLFQRLGVASYLGVPLTGTNGEVLGMLGLMQRRPFEHPPQAESLLRIFVSRAAAELERQQAEDALHQSQASLRRITDAVPGVVYQYRVGPDGAQSFPFASRGTIDLLGCESWELEANAQVGWQAVVPEDLEGMATSIGASAIGCTPWTHEFRVRSRNGIIRWLRGSSLPERQADGAIVWYGLFTDVTARREQERQLRFTQFAMDHAADAILVASPDMRIVYANQEACRSLRYPEEELLQLTIADIAPQYDPERIAARLALLRDGERLHYETVHRTKDGREFPVDVSVRYLEHEGVGYTCATARDITERQMLEQRLRHADRLATLGTITAGVAHELNNPLFVITGHLQLIERNLKRRQLKAIRTEVIAAQDAASRATGIVSQFLSTAHASTGVRERCDVPLIARRAVSLLRGDLRSREITIATDFPASIPPVVADPQALIQVFLNLLTNARQALQSAGGTGRIEFSLQISETPEGKVVECRLSDNGPGILPEHLPRIFDPFFTTKPVGEGTGLGLAICRRIVNELSGTIACDSEPGKGAAFIVRLPLSGSGHSVTGGIGTYSQERK